VNCRFSESLELSTVPVREVVSQDLVLEVWNDNQPLPDTLMGRTPFRLDLLTLTRALTTPGTQTLKLRQKKGEKGTITFSFSVTAPAKAQPLPAPGMCPPARTLSKHGGLIPSPVTTAPAPSAPPSQPAPTPAAVGAAPTASPPLPDMTPKPYVGPNELQFPDLPTPGVGAATEAATPVGQPQPGLSPQDPVVLQLRTMEARDLPETELLGKQDPYLRATLGSSPPIQTMTVGPLHLAFEVCIVAQGGWCGQVDNAGKAVKWEGAVLELRGFTVADLLSQSLALVVMNENLRPLPDTLIGQTSLSLDLETLTKLSQRPVPLEFPLSRPGKKKPEGILAVTFFLFKPGTPHPLPKMGCITTGRGLTLRLSPPSCSALPAAHPGQRPHGHGVALAEPLFRVAQPAAPGPRGSDPPALRGHGGVGHARDGALPGRQAGPLSPHQARHRGTRPDAHGRGSVEW
jgi:hypothetical protein